MPYKSRHVDEGYAEAWLINRQWASVVLARNIRYRLDLFLKGGNKAAYIQHAIGRACLADCLARPEPSKPTENCAVPRDSLGKRNRVQTQSQVMQSFDVELDKLREFRRSGQPVRSVLLADAPSSPVRDYAEVEATSALGYLVLGTTYVLILHDK